MYFVVDKKKFKMNTQKKNNNFLEKMYKMMKTKPDHGLEKKNLRLKKEQKKTGNNSNPRITVQGR